MKAYLDIYGTPCPVVALRHVSEDQIEVVVRITKTNGDTFNNAYVVFPEQVYGKEQ